MLLPTKAEVARHLDQYRAWERLLLADPADHTVRTHFENTAYTLCVLMGELTARTAADAAEHYLGLRPARRQQRAPGVKASAVRGSCPRPVRPSVAEERAMTPAPDPSPAAAARSSAARPAPGGASAATSPAVRSSAVRSSAVISSTVREPASRSDVPPVLTVPVLDVRPVLDCGRRPVKAVPGETFQVTATLFGEGHEAVGANVVLLGPDGRTGPWTPMRELSPGSDRWGAEVTPDAEGHWTYAVEAWTDPVTGWRKAAEIKIPAGLDTEVTLEEGALLFERAARGAPDGTDRRTLRAAADALRDELRPPAARLAAALTPDTDAVLARHPLRERVTRSHALPLLVERERALFGSWYEFFPRSEGAVVREGEPPVSGTFRTAAERLPAIADMGFDVVYLPPVHPIGSTFRKGPDNSLSSGPQDVGVPWAIGSPEGGHDAVHPDLGTLDDFDAFVRRAHDLDLEV
ncbi:maltotransferase domain-containing protein, partial [Streptomyces sp. G44]|uniref:maltotransferase domain-containing protein n=1 Tax=Streptomyces sp. G44 TaxID=2807632 RepID=UPI001EF97FE7